ncbi:MULTISPECIES: hypothetical protein [Pseudomonas]|uniref:Uncharacterized protein n=1 Tax=Pseudomonas neustonica TaxID=2487346 RepID=A0ABX9XDK4_9PSED|nr:MULTISPECIES: hypothetical protein [Pseudomonas]MBA6421263.1 hypothetical protein [Pseudomonas sp. 5Ae-yellow]ROZ80132.1 hypothetical protein EF099_18675 [Pseudomonas sp. SSM44]ROZ80974.1 hypothetical protein EF096_18480 [Pseudomonas neustonica]|tara:strand:- start:2888 stop:3358 length:471 start_codon:yes stop_codon:yes gene_type:complete
MYWMHKFTKQQEQTEKGREPFPSAITALLPELVFVMSYSEPSDDQGNWSGRTKMLNSIQEVIAELNAAAASCDLIIHSFYLITPICGDTGPSNQMEQLHRVTAETWDVAGFPCFGLRCEVDDDIVYNFIPTAAPDSLKQSELLFQHSMDASTLLTA